MIGVPFSIENTVQYQNILCYLQGSQRESCCPPEEVMDEICLLLRMDEDIQRIINEGHRFGVRFRNEHDFRNFLALLFELSYHTRRAIHRGYTPAELGLLRVIVEDVWKNVSYENNYVDPLNKMGRLLRFA